MSNYTITHLHSDLSNGTTNIDSVTKFNEYIARAKELNMKAIAFTEHGNIFSWEKKMDTCKENGIKYIHGVECYITSTLSEKIRDNLHTCLYALNTDGMFELNKLISKSFNRNDNHFYYMPRISIDEFLHISDNIAVSSACLGGVMANEKNEEIKEKYLNYFIKNKHRCFLEIQHHLVKDQMRYNEHLYNLHKKTGLKLIVGTDTHALNKEHLEGRSVLQKSKNIYFDNEEGWDLSLKTYDELIELFKEHNYIPIEEIKEALENTNVLADMVEEYVLDFTPKYPKLYDNSEKVFKEKIKKGVIERGIDKLSNFDEYKNRINEEFKVYKNLNAIDYMLLQTKILDDAREHGIQAGYGRGSVNGSIIAYLLKVTECDSLKFNLNFFRFLNPSRQSMPDIDIDYCKKDREWVKEYLFNINGIYAADIITFNTVADKGAIRDVGRALNIPLDEVSKICETFETDGDKLRKKYSELFKYVDIIKGTIVSIGTHPSGTIVSPISLDKYMGTCTLSTTKHPVSMLQMKEVDKLCYVKLDVLGLDNIGVINETCKMVGIDRLTPDTIDYEDDEVYESIKEDTTTVFQMESNMAQQYLKKILSIETIKRLKEKYPNIKKFDILKFTNGAIRPSGESFRTEASEGICAENGLKELDDMLYDSLGYCLVQEQIMMFLVKFCGYSMAESDSVRRAIAKKGGTEQYIPEITRRFIEYTTTNFEISEEKAKKIIIPFTDVIISAQNYGFSENHNFPYTSTSYICGYLRYYYPLEYLTVCLNTWFDDEDKTNRITSYAKKMGIKISSPKFRYSIGTYYPNTELKSIYKGIGSIKYCNEEIGRELYELKDNKYKNFLDLLIDITEKTSVNSRQLEILIKLDFFSEFGKSQKLLDIVNLYNKFYNKKQFKKDNLTSEQIQLIRGFSLKESEKVFKDVDTKGLIESLINTIPNKSISFEDSLKSELDYLGYIDYKNPKLEKRYVLITDVNTKYTPVVNTYCLNNGSTCKCKISKRLWNNDGELKPNDIIYIHSMEKKFGSKKVGETVDKKGNIKPVFEKTDELVWWITNYVVIPSISEVLEDVE